MLRACTPSSDYTLASVTPSIHRRIVVSPSQTRCTGQVGSDFVARQPKKLVSTNAMDMHPHLHQFLEVRYQLSYAIFRSFQYILYNHHKYVSSGECVMNVGGYMLLRRCSRSTKCTPRSCCSSVARPAKVTANNTPRQQSSYVLCGDYCRLLLYRYLIRRDHPRLCVWAPAHPPVAYCTERV